MSTNGKGLGRGLEALFNNQNIEEEEETVQTSSPLKMLPVDQVVPNPDQPRKFFDEESLKELSGSIRSRGILQPLLVQPENASGKYELIAGERRWRAAKMAGLEIVPVIVKEFNTEDTMLASLIENMHRQDLNPLEEAEAIAFIRDTLQLNQQDLANALGIQRGTVSNLLRLLKLTDDAKKDLAEGRISAAHARCLVVLPQKWEANLRRRIISKGLSVRATEMALSYYQTHNKFPWTDEEEGTRPYMRVDPNLKKISKEIGVKYNCKANIQGNAMQGKIAFTYTSGDELKELLTRFGVPVEEVEVIVTKAAENQAAREKAAAQTVLEQPAQAETEAAPEQPGKDDA